MEGAPLDGLLLNQPHFQTKWKVQLLFLFTTLCIIQVRVNQKIFEIFQTSKPYIGGRTETGVSTKILKYDTSGENPEWKQVTGGDLSVARFDHAVGVITKNLADALCA